MHSDLQLCVDACGVTQYEFVGDKSSAFPCFLVRKANKGLALVNQHQIRTTEKPQCIIKERGVCHVPVGLHAGRVCLHCCRYGHKAVKVRDDFPSIHFCSYECLGEASSFLDTFGATYTTLLDTKGDFIHICLLLLRLLHLRVTDECLFYRILQLETNPTSANASLNDLSLMMYRVLQQHSPDSLLSTDTPSLLYRCLQSLQYNAQPLSLTDLPSTTIYAIFPSLARINHSCRPNAVFSFCIRDNAVLLCVLALKCITDGEEITVSYLTDLCVPIAQRRKLLTEAFKFTCECDCCLSEQEEKMHTIAPASARLLAELRQQGHFDTKHHKEVIDHIEQSALTSDVYSACELGMGLLHSLQMLKEKADVTTYVRCISAILICWKRSLGCIPPVPSLLMAMLSACVVVLRQQKQCIDDKILASLLASLEPCLSAVRILNSCHEEGENVVHPYRQLHDKLSKSYNVLSSAHKQQLPVCK